MTIKIDFRRIFPGLVILLVGVGLFVLWLLLVFISFFAFFIPALREIFYLALDILLASLVMMVVGGVVIAAGVSGWRQMEESGWWAGGHVTTRVDKDRMTPGQRAGEVFGVFVSFFIILFFIENQIQNTGFFTSSFGPSEQALFYGSWLLGTCASLARAAVGRRNAVRPMDVLSGGMLALTSFYLLSVFPFDFAYLPHLIPSVVRWAISWISNPIGKLGLALGVVGGLASMLYNAVMYVMVRSRQRYGGTPQSW